MRTTLAISVLIAVTGVGCGGSDSTDTSMDSGMQNDQGTGATTSQNSGGSTNTGGMASSSGGSSTSSGGSSTSGGDTGGGTTGGTTDTATGGSNQPPPMDGNQNAACTSTVDCNMGLQCYGARLTGTGYCTIGCSTDDDCASLSGATYTCSGAGTCSASCNGPDDASSCPSGMECQQVGGFGGGFGGGMMDAGTLPDGGPIGTFRCSYPPPPPAQQWDDCTGGTTCDTDLVCTGGNNGGFCTATCTLDADCPAAPSGSLPVACIAGTGFNAGSDRCDIACTASDAGDPGCPDGMACVTITTGGGGGGGGGMSVSRCRYQ